MNHSMYLIKQAWAGLREKKGFATIVVITLGVTLGTLLCILTLAYLAIAKPLPYPEQENLYQLRSNLVHEENSALRSDRFNYLNLIQLYENQTVFSQSALVDYGWGVISSLPTQPDVNILSVTPEWFTLLGSKMAMGRIFEQTEAIDTYNPVAIISYESWQSDFNGDRSILDQTITISGTSFRVIGVLAETFVEPKLFDVRTNSDVFLPWDYNSIRDRSRGSWQSFTGTLSFLGKLDSELSTAQIEQNLTTLVNSTWQENLSPDSYWSGWSLKMNLTLLKKAILGESKNTVLLLLAGVIGLVLIAFANIINLFMSRTAEQQSQLAIQAAVGATKKHLFQTLFAQSGLIVFISALVALVIANVGFWIIQHYLELILPRVEELTISLFTLGSVILITLMLGFIIARLSANMINYRALNTTLQSSGKGTGIQISQKVRGWLVISQVTIVTVLVFVNMGLLRESLKIIHQPLGFETGNISSLTLSINDTNRFSLEEKKSLMMELKNKLIQLHQVEDVTQSVSPFKDSLRLTQTIETTQERLLVIHRPVDDLYFQMIRQPLIEGDYFSSVDIKDNNKLLIINDVYAARVAPQGSALGRKIKIGDNLYTISGVVKGVQIPTALDVPMRAYPVVSETSTRFLLKLKPQQTLSRELVVAKIREVTSQFSLQELETLDEVRVELLFTQYTTAITSAVLALLTFFLASIGLYGILSYSTQMRKFELGTRLAIGAKRFDVVRLIVKDNAVAVGIGFIISSAILLVLFIGYSEALAAYLNPQLVPLFIMTLGLISIMVLFACYWPLRPIINTSPIRSLRE